MIRVVELTKRFGAVTALSGASFTVPAHGTLAVLGPSGSGKTTLLRLIAGLDLPDEGEIYLNGELASRPGWALEPYRRGLGFLFQTPALWPHMTVAQNILFGLQRLPKKAAQERLMELLDQMSLSQVAQRHPYQISGGEARRVSLARTLAPRPPVLLLDEPLINLDPELKQHLLQIVRDTVQRQPATLIYVTHDGREAEALAQEVVILDKGRIIKATAGG
jgi:iron(III) transport system ATP-binding protein